MFVRVVVREAGYRFQHPCHIESLHPINYKMCVMKGEEEDRVSLKRDKNSGEKAKGSRRHTLQGVLTEDDFWSH